MDTKIPEELASTYRMLKKAYPGGVVEGDYLPLISLMSEELSQRNVAIVVGAICGKEYAVVYNDVLGLSQVEDFAPRVETVRRFLKTFGYDDWVREE